jgi:putative ABC transport system ATP-binding protein
MIEISYLRVEAGGRTILDLPEWRLEAGAAGLLLGPSGSGKTTLLNVLAGLIRPSAGSVKIDGQDIAAQSGAKLDKFRGARIGVVFQTLRLIRALSVRDNLALAMRLSGAKPDAARIAQTLERLGIGALASAKPARLSVGEGQRAAIARAVVSQPALLLADEPTSALDDANAEAAIGLLLEEAAACGATLVIATHDQRVKDRFAQKLVLEKRA